MDVVRSLHSLTEHQPLCPFTQFVLFRTTPVCFAAQITAIVFYCSIWQQQRQQSGCFQNCLSKWQRRWRFSHLLVKGWYSKGRQTGKPSIAQLRAAVLTTRQIDTSSASRFPLASADDDIIRPSKEFPFFISVLRSLLWKLSQLSLLLSPASYQNYYWP